MLEEIEKFFRERQERRPGREMIQVSVSPADILRPLSSDLLFKVNLPKVGEQAFVETTPILGRTAIDAARRLAESLKKRGADPNTEQILARLKREITRKTRQLKIYCGKH